MTTLAFDIEANGLLDTADTIWCLGIADTDDPRNVQLYSDHDNRFSPVEEGVQRLAVADRVVAHNGVGYDLPLLQKLYPGRVRLAQLWDTMVVGALHEPWRRDISLAGYGREIGYQKLDFNPEDYGVTWGTVNESAAAWEHMLEYCPADVSICALTYSLQLEKCLSDRSRGINWAPAMRLEHDVQVPLCLQMEHGFRLDVEAAERLEMELRDERDERELGLLEIYPPQYRPEKGEWDFKRRTWFHCREFTPKGNNNKLGYVAGAPLTKIKQEIFNPGSDVQCAQRLSALHGWTPSEFTDSGQPKMGESVLELLEYSEVEALLRYKRVSKMLSQLAEGDSAWLKRVDKKGYVHGYVRSNGARTYRMSHSRPNMAQVDKKDIRMRAVWLPDPGDDMVGVDADSLELRLLAAYLHPFDGGAYARAVLEGSKDTGTDAHSLNRDAVGLADRDNAKTFFYALVYGAGDGKLGRIVVDDAIQAGLPRPKGTLVQIGRAARSRIESGIAGLGELVAGVQGRASDRGFLFLPDGRPVKTGKRIALNSLLQGAGAVVMKKALTIFHFDIAPAEGFVGHYSYLANVHDEVQLSVNPEYAEAVGGAFADAIELAGKAYDLPVPMAGSYDIGSSWAETH